MVLMRFQDWMAQADRWPSVVFGRSPRTVRLELRDLWMLLPATSADDHGAVGGQSTRAFCLP